MVKSSTTAPAHTPDRAVSSWDRRVRFVAVVYLGVALSQIGIEAFIMLPGGHAGDLLSGWLFFVRHFVLLWTWVAGMLLIPPVLVPLALFRLMLPGKRGRRPAIALLLVVLGGVALLSASDRVVLAVRRAGLRAFVTRADTVVQAIHLHEREQGSPPASLDALESANLSPEAVHWHLRLRACNPPQYHLLPQNREFPRLPTWQIELTCPNCCFTTLDRLLYRSVPIYRGGMAQEHFGDWLYTWD